MPKAEAGSAKAIGNAMKARGLTKLRFYCQVCQKANRDEHAYKMHCESESHMRQLSLVAQNPNKAIDDFSQQFQDEFVSLLSRRFGTARIKANQVYQEYIQERHHLHMNATRWVTLTEFVKHLGREGIVHVDENEKGWFISWIDNSPAALKRQSALQKMERQKMDDEGRQRKYLKEQIEKAKQAEQENGQSTERSEQEALLKRDAGPIKLRVSLKSSSSTTDGTNDTKDDADQASTLTAAKVPTFGLQMSSSTSTSSAKPSAVTPFRMGANPLKASSKLPSSNPLKSSSSSSPSSSSTKTNQPGSAAPRTMAERIMIEERERRRKMSGPSPSSQPGVKRIRM